MTYPTEPQTVIGKVLHDRMEREAVKILLIGNPAAVEQCVIELERKGFCDSYAWSQALPIPENGVVMRLPRRGNGEASSPGEIMRLYKRWYPPTSQRIPL